MEARGIHHVGIAVDDLDEAVRTYERLFGGRLEHRERVADQGVEAASLRVGDGRVELLAAFDEDSTSAPRSTCSPVRVRSSSIPSRAGECSVSRSPSCILIRFTAS